MLELSCFCDILSNICMISLMWKVCKNCWVHTADDYSSQANLSTWDQHYNTAAGE